ncbi:MAG TPA: DUF2254 domain-containing protein [Marinagarivorans sp.]
MNKILFLVNNILRKLWVRCCAFCLLAIFAIISGPELGPYIPSKLKAIVSPETVGDILKILASSMLAVTTFSLSIMVQAFSTAATTASPRTNTLLMQNSTAQNALGAFIGAFLFSIVGIISIGANIYGEDVIFVLFIFTIIMIAIVVILLLKWIDQLSRLGRVSDTITTVEQTLRKAIKTRAQAPYLRANPMPARGKTQRYPLACDGVGYVQYIDIDALNTLAQKHDIDIFVNINPGKFMDSIIPLVETSSKINDAVAKDIIGTIVISDSRTFEQDPRYGFVVLSEIAIKALSPAINDPGTAIDIIGTVIRSMRLWVDSFPTDGTASSNLNVDFERIYMKPIRDEDVLEDIYSALTPEASKTLHVAKHLKKSLTTITLLGDESLARAAREWEKHFYASCKQHLSHSEYERLEQDR